MLADQLYQLLPTSVKDTSLSFLLKVLKPRMRSHFSTFISPGDLVFDVGANVGDLTQIFLDLGARVVCIEPQPYCILRLHERFANNPHVTIVEKGVNHKEGKLSLYLSKETHKTSTFSEKIIMQGRFTNRTWDKKINVPVTTLELLIGELGAPVFCKIDVEGFERQALQGLGFRIPSLSFEFHREFLDDAKFCAARLSSMGNVMFNYSLFLTYSLRSDRWLTFNQLFSMLETKGKALNGYLSGDIYARFT